MLLAVNAGSSSLKILLFDDKSSNTTLKWEKEFSRMVLKENSHKKIVELPSGLETCSAFAWILNYLHEKSYIKSFEDIDKIGYRFAHGGTVFVKPTLVDDEVIKKLRDIDNLSITHNPSIRKTVEEGYKLLPKAKHIMCFDTDFHSTIPPVASMYGINLDYYIKGIRKYGFHGLSYKYVGLKVANMLGKPFSKFSGIICHLGNGSSITAIENGKSVDTTMGFTPVDGLVMGQRSGSVDPTVVQAIMKLENVDIDRAIEILSQESGFKAISGISSDYRVLVDAIRNKVPNYWKAQMAIDLFQYQIRKYIGSFMAILSHVDAIVFTGGIGENDANFVKQCVNTQGLRNLGVVMMDEFDKSSTGIPVLQIPTNEELAIIEILKSSY